MVTDTRLDEAKIYTMRQLNQDTGGVLREITEAGQPALVTRRGRFVARISPTTNSNFEANALAVLLAHGQFKEQYTGARTADGISTSDELLASLPDLAPPGPNSTGSAGDREPGTYTMRELSHRTADVIRSINQRDKPVYITRRGRVLAVISPLASARLEEVALAAVLGKAGAAYAAHEVDKSSLSSVETADDIGVTWRGAAGPEDRS